MVHGRSVALAGTWWAGRGKAARGATLAVLVPAGMAVFFLLVAALAARQMVAALATRVSRTWAQMSLYARLTAGMVAVWPVADLARELGLLPRWHMVSMLTGAIGTGLFGACLAALRARGHRRWRDRGGAVLRGERWQDMAQANAQAIRAVEHECACLRAKLSDVLGLMGEYAAEAGIDRVRLEPVPARHLRLVTDGSGPQSRRA